MKLKSSPIGVFDSGMGGLTVLNALRKALPGEDFIYFGDTAHLPYGSKSEKAVKKFSLTVGNFFRDKRVKMMVVACNTASVYALEELERRMPFKVTGVILPGVRAAIEADSGKKTTGIIGTYGTVKSGIYEKRILEINPRSEVRSRACPLFVPLVEEGWIDHPVTWEIAEIYLAEFSRELDSLILGCTHYPLLKKVISDVAGPEVKIIDSALQVASEVKEMIVEDKLASGEKTGKIEFYVSDSPELFKSAAPIFLDNGIKVEKVGIVETELSEDSNS